MLERELRVYGEYRYSSAIDCSGEVGLIPVSKIIRKWKTY
jgi:hypothetical protein